MMNADDLHAKLKGLIVERLNFEGLSPDEIDDDMSLFEEGLGLDSVDVLELVVMVEKEFGIKIKSQDVDQQAFRSVRALATFIQQHQAAGA